MCFGLSGFFESNLTYKSVVNENAPVFNIKGKAQEEKYRLIFFQISALIFSFIIGYSLRSYEVFGIDFSYIFTIAKKSHN